MDRMDKNTMIMVALAVAVGSYYLYSQKQLYDLREDKVDPDATKEVEQPASQSGSGEPPDAMSYALP